MDNIERTKELFKKINNEKDESVVLKYRNEIVEQNIKLVTNIIMKRYKNNPFETIMTDIFQDGYEGLIRSVNKYDINKGYAFSTFAVSYIEGYIKKGLESRNYDLKYSSCFRVKAKRIRKFQNSYFTEYRKNPSFKEIKQETQFTDNTIKETLIYYQNNRGKSRSLNSIVNEENHGIIYTVEDKTVDLNKNIELEFISRDIISAINELNESDKNKQILRYRYGFEDGMPYTCQAIADKYGCSKENIRLICQRCILKLQKSEKIQKYDDFYSDEISDNVNSKSMNR